MLKVFESVKGLVKLNPVCIDNNVFRLHYKATMIILIAFSLVVTAHTFIGDPISCLFDNSKNDKEVTKAVNTYCWIQSTYTIPFDRFKGKSGADKFHAGVGPGTDDSSRKYYAYYQWVCFVLFFQAILFYVPHYLWKIWEGGRMKALVSDLKSPILSQKIKSTQKKIIIDYFLSHLHIQNHHAFQFITCEILNFVNIILQMYLIDLFLGGEFITYGPRVLAMTELEPEFRSDPMSTIFPKITKCDFYKYGPSGSIMNVDVMCILPLNIVNEKIYVFLWFWLVMLSVISGLVLIYRAVILLSPQLRLMILCIQSRHSQKIHLKALVKKFKIGDWFILHQLGKNIDPLTYEELIIDLAELLDGKKKNYDEVDYAE